MTADIVVIGAGTVGSAIAYGLAAGRLRVLMLDGGDRDLRAAVANFGLVWCQGKGLGLPAYQQLTSDSVEGWAAFNAELSDLTAIDLQFEQNGGLAFCLGDEEFEKRRLKLLRLHNQLGGEEADWEMLDRTELAKLLPKVVLGPEVTGASFGRRDGHTNPLHLLSALQAGFVRRGGVIRGGCKVDTIMPSREGGFTLSIGDEKINAPRIVIAAGLGSKVLAAQVDIYIPLRPQRGQILVTERVEPFLPLPCSGLRQTREGTIMMGTTHEEAGEDMSTTTSAAASLSSKAISRIPALRDATLVRQWAGLRILTPDSYPIYAQSPTYPSAFVALCHSGVTLASIHSTVVADAIAAGQLPPAFNAFHQRRFDVPKAA